ncbi:hypothetical protein ccbrp13_66240 [Ktedonobacteria bacterium brp13]|nr:hypothetical protein ccbrp13_66240 [Ktedonobacteria bacterium brp13]
MATNRSPIVGIFDNRAQAENAIEQLYNAGVNSDRIRYSGNPATETKTDTSHSFMDDLKGLFTGASTTGHRSVDIVNDLTAMGLDQDAAQYYAQEYETGHTILAVEPLGQQDEAMNILRSNGAHDFNDRSNFDKISGYNKGTPNTYDQNASTSSTYNQSQGTPNAYGQQANVDRDAALNTPTAPASGYDQGTANQGGNTFQQSSATQTSATQGYTTSNSYPQSSQQPQQSQTNPIDPYHPTTSGQQTQGQQVSNQDPYAPDAFNQGTASDAFNQGMPSNSNPASRSIDPTNPNAFDQNQNAVNPHTYSTYGQDPTDPNASNPTATSTPRDSTTAPGAFDRSSDPNTVQGTYDQNTDPNTYGRTRDTDNPLKRFARKLKGEPDADADYNRNQIDAERDSDPNR